MPDRIDPVEVVRNPCYAFRLARARADYEFRRRAGFSCCDPREQPKEADFWFRVRGLFARRFLAAMGLRRSRRSDIAMSRVKPNVYKLRPKP